MTRRGLWVTLAILVALAWVVFVIWLLGGDQGPPPPVR